MFGFLTSRFQSASEKKSPGWYDRHIAPVLLSIAKKACTHPIHTIVTIAFLASYSYLGVLDKGLLDSASGGAAGKVDFVTLLAGGQRLRVGEETSWKWEAEDAKIGAKTEQVRAGNLTVVACADRLGGSGTGSGNPGFPRIELDQWRAVPERHPKQCNSQTAPELLKLFLYHLT
jgi:hypothetical protein